MRWLALSLLSLCASLPAQLRWLEREPQVWSPSDSRIVIGFRSNDDAVGEVQWGPSPALGNLARGPKVRNHFITLRGLAPDRFYYYRVRVDRNPWTPVYRARTFPASGSDVTFFVMGDTGAFTPMQWAVRDLLERWSFDLGLLPGDIVYPDGAREHFNWRFFWPYASLLRHTPFFPALGNHDLKDKNGAAYFRYFHLPAGNSGTEHYYSFDSGAVHFVGLDSEATSLNKQADWLRTDVAGARAGGARWVFVHFHRPAYSSGEHGRSRSIHAAWSRLFEELEVDAVFTGHDHHYERSKVVRDFFPGKRGVVYYVVGTGGQWVRAPPRREPYSAFATARNGFLKVDVRGDVMRTSFVDASFWNFGKELDPFVLRKGPVTAALRARSEYPVPGATFLGALDAPAGRRYGLLLAGRPGHLPTPWGVYHLAPGGEVVVQSGTVGAAESVPFALRVPANPGLKGAELLFQGWALQPFARLALTDLLSARVR